MNEKPITLTAEQVRGFRDVYGIEDPAEYIKQADSLYRFAKEAMPGVTGWTEAYKKARGTTPEKEGEQ